MKFAAFLPAVFLIVLAGCQETPPKKAVPVVKKAEVRPKDKAAAKDYDARHQKRWREIADEERYTDPNPSVWMPRTNQRVEKEFKN